MEVLKLIFIILIAFHFCDSNVYCNRQWAPDTLNTNAGNYGAVPGHIESNQEVRQCVRLYQFYHDAECWTHLHNSTYTTPVRLTGPLRQRTDIDAQEWFAPLQNSVMQKQMCESGGILAVTRYLRAQKHVCRWVGFISWKEAFKAKPSIMTRGSFIYDLHHGYIFPKKKKIIETEDGEIEAEATDEWGYGERREKDEPHIFGWYTDKIGNLLVNAEDWHPGFIDAWEGTLNKLWSSIYPNITSAPLIPGGFDHTWLYTNAFIIEYESLLSLALLLEAHTAAFYSTFASSHLYRSPAKCPLNTEPWPATNCYCFVGERVVDLWAYQTLKGSGFVSASGNITSMWIEKDGKGTQPVDTFTRPRVFYEPNDEGYRWTDKHIEAMYLARLKERQYHMHMFPFGTYPDYQSLIFADEYTSSNQTSAMTWHYTPSPAQHRHAPQRSKPNQQQQQQSSASSQQQQEISELPSNREKMYMYLTISIFAFAGLLVILHVRWRHRHLARFSIR